MPERLSASSIHEWLDHNGHYPDCKDAPGVYALRLNVPNDAMQVWTDSKCADPPVSDFFTLIERMGLVYVGKSDTDLYGRLQQHGDGESYQPSITSVYDPVEVLAVRVGAGITAEYEYAREIASRFDTVTWSNGDVYV